MKLQRDLCRFAKKFATMCTEICIDMYRYLYRFLDIYINFIKISAGFRLIGLVDRVLANGPGDLGSIPGCIIPKTLKWYLIPPWLTLSNIRYISRVKWSNPGKGVASSPTPWCNSY